MAKSVQDRATRTIVDIQYSIDIFKEQVLKIKKKKKKKIQTLGKYHSICINTAKMVNEKEVRWTQKASIESRGI